MPLTRGQAAATGQTANSSGAFVNEIGRRKRGRSANNATASPAAKKARSNGPERPPLKIKIFKHAKPADVEREEQPPNKSRKGPSAAKRQKQPPAEVDERKEEPQAKKSTSTKRQLKSSSKKANKGRYLRSDREKAIEAFVERAEQSRTKFARHVTFDIKHPSRANVTSDDGCDDKGFVFFYSATERYGGPVNFLSNFFRSDFEVPEIADGHVFKSVEQLYQFSKTKHFKLARELIVTVPGDGDTGFTMSSYEIPQLVLAMEYPLATASIVRRFVSAGRAKSEQWYQEWSQPWEFSIPYVLKIAVEAKFRDDAELRDKLMRTGNYELVEASKGDTNCGIGYTAKTAFENRSKWMTDMNRNLLGRALMNARKRICDKGEEAYSSESFDRQYYDEKVLNFWKEVCESQEAAQQSRAKGKTRKDTEKN